MRTEKFYHNRLEKYYRKHYGQYDDTIEWFINPKINIWRFYIPEEETIVYLECFDNGMIKETIYR